MWISFIDDMLVVCNEKYMDDVKQKFTNTVDCDDMGAMVEYIGTKIDIDKTQCELKITQPVLVQSGLQVFLNKSPIAHKSKMQSSASLSMAEGELIAACDAAQIMLFVMHILEDMGLRVKKPMILRVDCKGAIDLTYGWNVCGLTKHASIKACFLRELKEANTVLCVWMPTTANLTDMYTKNLTQQLYDRHRSTIVRDNNIRTKIICGQYWRRPTSKTPILQGRVLGRDHPWELVSAVCR